MGISLKGLGEKFNTTTNLEVSEGKFLQGDKIHEVVFKEIRKEQITSKAGDTLNLLTIVFVDAADPVNGRIFEDKTFEFNEKSLERTSRTFGSNTIESPSAVETTVYKYLLFINGVLPKVGKALAEGKKKIGMDSWDQFTEQMVNLFTKGVEKFGNPVCKLKLIKNKSGFATLPFFLAVGKDGECYMNNAFFGNVEELTAKKKDIFFTDKEVTAIKNREANKSAIASNADVLAAAGNSLTDNSDIMDISDEDFDGIGL